MGRRSSPAPLDDGDLLEEILLRLPPKPSSLRRASLVCRRWRGILADRRFVQRFRKHHQKPPLLGYFGRKYEGAGFTAMSGFTPNTSSIPRLRHLTLVDCRHGVALFLDHELREILVWNPIAGLQRHVAFPPGCDCVVETAAVLCAVSDDLPVQGDCHLSAFTLVLVGDYPNQAKAITYLYESKSDTWGKVIMIAARYAVYMNRPSVLVGNTLCWLLYNADLLQFDFGNQTFVVIEKPADAYAHVNCCDIVGVLKG
ncbi:uncharacterized protein [Aegilops tauschii subsp. strangulata]|uniref:uncharacterized protein n=1 Tax=Aegilops tauschii subsp. strangulata TaxID=200361 RepID=UPI00098B1921|nr:uncharacterized protein LOC109734715 [Aegilops tauschii subsp. strangulata]